MKAPLSWLREFVPNLPDADDLAEILLRRGFEVETIIRQEGFGPLVVVGRILAVEKHPGADRLQVARVDAGQGEPLGIVCGAPNIKPGQSVPTALPGAILPGNLRIKKSRIRGVESAGMLCSAAELKLAEDAQGILILHEGDGGPAPGTTFDLFRGAGDPVLDVNIPPNRGDGLSIVGLAREAASALRSPMNWRPPSLPRWGGPSPVAVEIQDRQACPAYSGLAMRGAMSRPTPGTAVRRLEAAGLRSLGSLVDATNYVLLELGHPVHIFDRAALSGSKVFVRRARQGESLVALDGRRLDLDPQDLVIADSRAPVALAGVIGGRDSGVREGTRDVFLECAAFDPAAVRASSRRLGLSTDSSARFERRVPAAGLPLALARLAQLTAEWSGAEPDGFVAAEGDVKDRRTLIPFDPERAAAWLGYEDPKPKAAVIPALFQTLGLSVGGKPPVYEVSVPYYRPDLRIPEDLYEEAARTLGLDDLPETLPGGRLPRPRRDPLAEWTAEARRVLSGLGFQEAVSLPFQEDAGTGHGGADGASLAVVNPLQKGAGSLRAALVPGLIRAAAHNMARGVYDLRLFETGVVFQAGEAGSAPREEVRLAGLAAGGAHPDSWGEERPADLFDLRGMVEVLASRLRLPLEWVSDGSASGAPGARWSLRAGGAPLGWAGRAVPPRGLLPKNAPPVYAFELSLTRGLGRRASRAAAEGPPRFPAVGRDVNFVVPDSVPAANLEDLIRKAAGGDLESVRLRDLYRGRQVPEGFRSLTYALVFRAGDRTLVESDVDGRMAAVLAAAERDLGVRIRS